MFNSANKFWSTFRPGSSLYSRATRRTTLCTSPLPRMQITRPATNYSKGHQYSKPRIDNRRLMLVGGGGVLFGAYYVTHLEDVPITGRRRMIDVSPETERNMGVEAWEQVKEEYRSKILPESDPRVKLVKRLAKPIIAVSGLDKLEWEFIVVNERDANAFVLPGGKVCVFTGIMNIASEPDELATVLSHEIAHVVARHNAEKWSFARILYYGGTGLKIALGDVIPDALLNYLMYFGMQLPFSRRCESEADHIGLLLMAKACYDPNKAVDLWTKMSKESGGSGESLLKYASTHPSHGDRVENIKKLLPQAHELQEQSDCHHHAWARR